MRQRGFTLLELLVVLLIMGIMASVAALSIANAPRRHLDTDAARLAQLFEAAGDEARLRNRPVAWSPDADGFRFLVRRRDGWQPIPDDLFKQRTWDMGGTSAEIRTPPNAAPAGMLVFGLEAVGVPALVVLRNGDETQRIVSQGDGRFTVASP